MKKRCTIHIVVSVILILTLFSKSGIAQTILELNPINKSVKPFVSAQLWNAASFSHQSSSDEEVDDRYTSYFRRLRFGLKGRPLDRLYYNVMISGDYLGKDNATSGKGSSSGRKITIWSAYLSYKLSETNDWFHVTGGYFLPHMSRESCTAPWTTASLDKSEISCYLRRFATGKNNGVNSGLNLGGFGRSGNIALYYNVALVSNMNNTSSQGSEYNPLFLGHAIVMLGDAEQQKYTYTMNRDFSIDKTSISFGIGGSYQDKCDFYTSNQTLSGDVYLRLNKFHLLAEGSLLQREPLAGEEYKAFTYQVRAGALLSMKKCLLEPTFTLRSFDGDDTSQSSEYYSGEDTQYDVGINWWFAKKSLAMKAHYLKNDASGTNFGSKEESGYKKGDLLVLGLQLVL